MLIYCLYSFKFQCKFGVVPGKFGKGIIVLLLKSSDLNCTCNNRSPKPSNTQIV